MYIMSSNLVNGYYGADIDFINDSTQNALDLKANLAGGNTFTGNQTLNAGSFEIQATGGYLLQTPQIVGNDELYMRTIGNSNIRLEPAGTGETTSTKNINLSTGKEYRVNGTNILTGYATENYVDAEDAKKANLAGGNTFTGDQEINGDVDINGYATLDRALIQATSNDYPPFKVTNPYSSYTTAQIDGAKNALLVRSDTTLANDRILSVMNNSKNDYVLSVRGDGKTEMKDLNVDGVITGTKLNLAGLPTNASGLAAGDIYSDSGTLKIVS